MTDASQPWDGVPLHPETRRFHLLRHSSSGDKKAAEWWPPGEDAAGPFKAMWFGVRWGMPKHVSAEYEYLGPLYTKSEAAALAEAAAVEMRTAASQAARSALRLKPDDSAPTADELAAVTDVNDAIMSLPLPAPSLDAIRAEERRKGMEEMARVVSSAAEEIRAALAGKGRAVSEIDDLSAFLAGITPEERRIIAGLRDGSLVAVQRGDLETLKLAGATVGARLQEISAAMAAQFDRITAMLAAAEPPR